MYDQYIEILIKRRPVQGANIIKSAMLIFIIALFIIGVAFKNPIFYIFAVILVMIYYFKILRLNSEFEYFYMDGELDIAQIFNKSKRKNVMCINESMIKIIAPIESQEVQAFGHIKTIDCSANDLQEKPYAIICCHEGVLKNVLIQMDDNLLKALKQQMPSKVKV